jgi:hypothetical protein
LRKEPEPASCIAMKTNIPGAHAAESAPAPTPPADTASAHRQDPSSTLQRPYLRLETARQLLPRSTALPPTFFASHFHFRKPFTRIFYSRDNSFAAARFYLSEHRLCSLHLGSFGSPFFSPRLAARDALFRATDAAARNRYCTDIGASPVKRRSIFVVLPDSTETQVACRDAACVVRSAIPSQLNRRVCTMAPCRSARVPSNFPASCARAKPTSMNAKITLTAIFRM